MNPETETNINEAINWLQQTGGQIQDFAAEQAPLYCREVVAWEFWQGLTLSVIGLMIIIIPLIALWRFRKWIKQDLENVGAGGFFSIMGSIILTIVGFVIIAGNAPCAIKAVVAPRLVIVEHLRGLKP